ncbi:hypothetical protein, partial [Megasphaera cerevisiae]|uniref:hypothetical protein n=1 Tax=Megasphaera cerevisiae TaxID=39029 RepID=UPI000AF9914D
QWGILTFTYSQTTNNVRYYDATVTFPLQVTTTMYVGAMHLGGSTSIPAASCGTAVSNGSASLRFGTTYANSNTMQGFIMIIGTV